MSERYPDIKSPAVTAQMPRRIGVVVHPSRDVEEPLRALREWTDRRGVEVVQVPASCPQRQVAEERQVSDCDLIVSIGGDGTTLAAVHAAAVANRPVLGVAWGSLGALTSIAPSGVGHAVERFSTGDWIPRALPALEIAREKAPDLLALNDIAIVRAGEGQVRVSARVDGALFARVAGDGCIVSTPIGSSAYALSAGGPLLAPSIDAFVITPLPTHGGFCPPLAVAASSELRLEAVPGHGGARIEVDGQVAATHVEALTIRLRPGVATVVTFPDQEPFLAGLRRRRIIVDSPRIVIEEAQG